MFRVQNQGQDQGHGAGQQQLMKEEEVELSAAAAAADVDDDEPGSVVGWAAPETQNFLEMILPKFEDTAVMVDVDADDEDFVDIAVLMVEMID